MFTVLILNEKTMDSFYEHLPLFNGFLDAGQMDICLWNENGKTLEEALPDLHRLTDARTNWRAVIVRHTDGKTMASHPTRLDNPYDFLENGQNPISGISQEALYANTLLRLCSQLSMPLQKASRQRAASDLENAMPAQLGYDGILPDSISLISVRHTDGLLQIQGGLNTLDKADFAWRNGYPSICRFAVCDRYAQGPYRKREDDFLFWTAVVLLANNRIDSSLMQAYTLYSLRCRINLQQMAEMLSEKCALLERDASALDHILANKSVYLEKEEGPYPDYSVPAPSIDPSLLQNPDPISAKGYLLPAANGKIQAKAWMKESTEAKEHLADQWQSFPAKLQKKTPALQKQTGADPDNADILSPLQQEQLSSEIQELYLRILKEQAELPDLGFEKGDAIDQAADKVSRLLTTRLTSPAVYLWMAALAGCGLASMLPALLAMIAGRTGGRIYILLALAILLLLPAGYLLLALRREQKSIKRAIAGWNAAMAAQVRRLEEYAQLYAGYIADVLSYRKGKSYLEQAILKNEEAVERQRMLEKQKEDIVRFLRLMKTWAVSMGLILYPEEKNPKETSLEELQNPELKAARFMLETRYQGQCEINETGRMIASPFSFIEKLEIRPIVPEKPGPKTIRPYSCTSSVQFDEETTERKAAR